MMDSNKIFLTEKSAAAARQLMEERGEDLLQLRLYIEGKGCDGFYYGVSFDQATSEDSHFEDLGVKIIVDKDTLRFCDGSTIDWVDDERGKGFLVDNPNHNKFRGKFFRRKNWESLAPN